MKNTIEAHVEFSFQGKIYSLSSIIDIDQLMEHEHAFSSLHGILAKEHNIDTYSYLYEVMLETEIKFKNAQGIAEKYITDEIFDLDGFTAGWQEQKVLSRLQPIAMREMGITNLDQHRELKNALVQAYNLGRQA